MMDRIEQLENQVVLLRHELKQIQSTLTSFARLPAWRADLEKGLEELHTVCGELGHSLEGFYDNSPGGTSHPNQARDAVIKELARRGWAASRIGLVARMSERAVRRVLSRAKTTAQ